MKFRSRFSLQGDKRWEKKLLDSFSSIFEATAGSDTCFLHTPLLLVDDDDTGCTKS